MSTRTNTPTSIPEANTTSWENSITVMNNETYQINDLHLTDNKGRIIFTVSTTVLRPSKQTSGHAHDLDDEEYEFISGSGVMILGKTAIFVKAGKWVHVEKTNFHKVINDSAAVDLVFRCYFHGKIVRPHLK